MALKVKENVRLPKSSDDVINYIKAHHVRVEDVAENLVDDHHPNGFHANWLRVLVHRGMSDSDKHSVKVVVDKLSRQKQQIKGNDNHA